MSSLVKFSILCNARAHCPGPPLFHHQTFSVVIQVDFVSTIQHPVGFEHGSLLEGSLLHHKSFPEVPLNTLGDAPGPFTIAGAILEEHHDKTHEASKSDNVYYDDGNVLEGLRFFV